MKTIKNKSIMKNLLVLTIVMMGLFSCSSEDSVNSDSIIGQWKLTSHSDVEDLPDCMKNTIIIFNSNNTITGTVYEADCDKNTVSGNYAEVTESIYKITFPNSNSSTEVTVELSSNKLIWTEKNSFTTRVLGFARN